MIEPPPFTLDEPGTIEFTARRALEGQALNRFALSLRRPENRETFVADETAYMRAADLSEAEIDLVARRDWTGLMRAGGHLQSVLKLAATVGQDLWHVGAHNVGCTKDELLAACPRRVDGLPGRDA